MELDFWVYIFNSDLCIPGFFLLYHYWWYYFNHTLILPLQFSVQFNSVTQSCLTLCDPVDCSMPGFPVHHQLSELVQTHVHRVGDAIQPSDPLSSPSPPAFNLSQHQGLFQWVRSLYQVTKVLEFQLQHPSVLPMNIQAWFLLGLTVLPNKNNYFISDLQTCARI